MPSKIMIMSCTNKQLWYADKIGKIYRVIAKNGDNYQVGDRKQIVGLVKIHDCEGIE